MTNAFIDKKDCSCIECDNCRNYRLKLEQFIDSMKRMNYGLAIGLQIMKKMQDEVDRRKL